MTDYNHIGIQGRLTRDAELKYTSNGTAVCNFSIAVNRSIPPKADGGEWKNEASFIDVQLWGKAAESKAPTLLKGKQVLVGGQLRQDRWEKDGQNHSRIYIVADTVNPLAEGKKTATNDAEQPAPPASTTSADDFSDDIPF